MATTFSLRLRQAVVGGAPLILILDNQTLPNEVQIICVSGDPIQIEGTAGTILGLPTTPITLEPSQGFNFNEQQYEVVIITIPVGTEYKIIANQ